jgi:ClpP class serine protease
MTLDQIVMRLVHRPLLMDLAHARRLFSSLAGKMNIAHLSDAQGEVALGEKMRIKSMAGIGGEGSDRYRPYRLVDGIAVVPVTGTLLHRYQWIDSWATGYDAVVRMVELAVEDPDVDGILLDIDSPGGEAAGCFDAARQLRALGEKKPLASLCNDMTLSGAMALASAAEHRYITSTGEAGSVGVAMAHWSYEDMIKNDGVEVTLIYAGEHKVDGNMYQHLPEAVYTRFKNECQDLRQEFAAIVGEHVGVSLDSVLATEAAIYRGQAAIDVGFANELVNSHAAISAFRNYLSPGDGSANEGTAMTNKTGTTAAKPSNNAESAAGEQNQQQPTGDSQLTAQASASDERARIKGITTCEAAKGRETLANHLAFDTTLSVEDAVKILEKSEMTATLESTDDTPGAFGRAMQAHASSGVEAGGEGDSAAGAGNANTPAATAARIAGGYNRMKGRGA